MDLTLHIESINKINNSIEFLSTLYDKHTNSNLHFKIYVNKKIKSNINDYIDTKLKFENLEFLSNTETINFKTNTLPKLIF